MSESPTEEHTPNYYDPPEYYNDFILRLFCAEGLAGDRQQTYLYDIYDWCQEGLPPRVRTGPCGTQRTRRL